ncbi:hypothetical protein H6G93_33955 [Nostoc sp. FACHB-973]|nr:hypothetical protein [Nostoc sp. FACHB-973]MBX9255354.1 hypothetical protein [Desmonostoc muscorum CCALA 125]
MRRLTKTGGISANAKNLAQGVDFKFNYQSDAAKYGSFFFGNSFKHETSQETSVKVSAFKLLKKLDASQRMQY